MRAIALLLLLATTAVASAAGVQAVGCKSHESAVAFAREYSSGKKLEDALESLPTGSDGFRPCMFQKFEISDLSGSIEEIALRENRAHVKKGTVSGIWGMLNKKPVLMPLREHTRFIIDNLP